METSSPVRRRVGGRNARVRAAVHDAVKQLIAENGPGQVSIAAVATRSGVHPTSIYRRWGAPETFALDVAVGHLEVGLPMPDTGALRWDLLAYVTHAAEELNRPDGLWLLQALLAARSARKDTDLPSNLQSRAKQIQDMLDRARKREEPELRFTDVIDGVLGQIYMRSVFEIGGVNETYLAALVDRTITAPVLISGTSPAPRPTTPIMSTPRLTEASHVPYSNRCRTAFAQHAQSECDATPPESLC